MTSTCNPYMVNWKPVLASALLGLFVSSLNVDAAPVTSVHREYFNAGDTTFTTAVGARWVLRCDGSGNQQVWGRVTGTFRESRAPCAGARPPVDICYIDNVSGICP